MAPDREPLIDLVSGLSDADRQAVHDFILAELIRSSAEAGARGVPGDAIAKYLRERTALLRYTIDRSPETGGEDVANGPGDAG
jgi:hypothetical protein